MKIDTLFFEQKTVLVFGFGKNGGGSGTLQFLLSTTARKIIITDQKTPDLLGVDLSSFKDSRIQVSLGQHKEEDFLEADIIIKNPVIPWGHPLLEKATQKGAAILLDSTIFMALCPVPVIGITGSKGKTTVASLISHILKTAGYAVVPVGVSQTGVLSELSKVQKDSVVVFELSSWRLSGLRAIEKSPALSVITNLYPDHLNYYPDMEGYARDKRVITDFQHANDFLILESEGKWTDFFTANTKAKIKYFGRKKGLDAWQDERALYLQEEGADLEILEKEKSTFRGDYSFQNFLAASLAAHTFGVSTSNIIEGIRTFPGVPHRAELVREHNSVSYVNDTAATIPAAALASLQSFKTPVILLAGGSDKGLPLTDLVSAILQSKHTILFAGTGTDKLVPILKEKGAKNYQIKDSMEEAVMAAQAEAKPGDTVLLAPGAASFGMFQNEFDRAEQFVKAVRAL